MSTRMNNCKPQDTESCHIQDENNSSIHLDNISGNHLKNIVNELDEMEDDPGLDELTGLSIYDCDGEGKTTECVSSPICASVKVTQAKVVQDLSLGAVSVNQLDEEFDLWNTDSQFTKFVHWIHKQPWLAQFHYGVDGMIISVKNDTEKEAQQVIDKSDFKDIGMAHPYTLTRSETGKYVPCTELLPNQRIKYNQQAALYSGAITGRNIREQRKHGVTISHGFDVSDNPNPACDVLDVATNTLIGTCIAQFRTVSISGTPMTADIAFVEPNEQLWEAVNIVDHRPGVDALGIPVQFQRTASTADLAIEARPTRYKLRIYKGKRRQKGEPIMIVDRNGVCRSGIIKDDVFTDTDNNFSFTLAITDESGNQKISEQGDCGALVTSVPSVGVDELDVFGIVIGFWYNQQRSLTVASRFWDVIYAIASDPDKRNYIFHGDLHLDDVKSFIDDIDFSRDN